MMKKTRLKLSEDTIRELCGCWEELSASERSARVEHAARDCCVTSGTVYRRVKEYRERGRSLSERRTDKSSPRILDAESLEVCVKKVMGLKAIDPYKPNKRIANPNKCMSTSRAIEILERMGEIPAGVLTARTVNRWANIWGITVRNICSASPAVKLVSHHPNHVHVIDFSVCEQYYLRDEDGKVIQRPFTYKNKPNEAKQKIWSFSLVDHYTGANFIKYFLSPGESSDMLFQGLVEAWSKKDDSQFPFHGTPRILYADKGSALRSERIQNLLHALGVEPITHMPGNPRAKGMVESSFKHLQTQFETKLRLLPAMSIDELNDRAYNWLIHHNWSAKSGEEKTRFAMWQGITNEQLLEMPNMDVLRKVTASHEIRTVDAYCSISLNGEKYGVPEILMGKKVRVWHNMDGGISVQDIQTGEVHPTEDIRRAVFGTFNAHKKSEVERRQDAAISEADDIRKRIRPEHLLYDTPNMHAFPKEGSPIEVDSELAPKVFGTHFESMYQAKLAIADELRINLGDLPGWMLEEIEAALEVTLEREKVMEIAKYVGELVAQRGAV
ncbi:MAG: hypothetical protein AVO39_10155 [delta proteobacterium MLS_D]|nr:MAG: hypothetical protein AVO39_10155 [delta proteobacterium MLS_D]